MPIYETTIWMDECGAVFSHLISIVMPGVSLDQAQTYLDDILIACFDFDDHLCNLNEVLNRLTAHGLKLNASKCALFRAKVDYLGHEISSEGIRPLQTNIHTILEFPLPKTVKQLRRFNGMVNFYRKFLQNGVKHLSPLYAATSGKVLLWTKECIKAFEWVKAALTSAPILAYLDFLETNQFIVTSDTSATGAGAVLSQVQAGVEQAIAYAGVSFNDAQKRYSATDKELAAILFAVQHFKPYLYGRNFVIRTDNEPLIYLNHMKRVDDRLHRILEDLAIGHYIIEYVPGEQNTVADALSCAEYPWALPDEPEFKARTEDLRFDQNQWLFHTVPGGPGSLCDCLTVVLGLS